MLKNDEKRSKSFRRSSTLTQEGPFSVLSIAGLGTNLPRTHFLILAGVAGRRLEVFFQLKLGRCKS